MRQRLLRNIKQGTDRMQALVDRPARPCPAPQRPARAADAQRRPRGAGRRGGRADAATADAKDQRSKWRSRGRRRACPGDSRRLERRARSICSATPTSSRRRAARIAITDRDDARGGDDRVSRTPAGHRAGGDAAPLRAVLHRAHQLVEPQYRRRAGAADRQGHRRGAWRADLGREHRRRGHDVRVHAAQRSVAGEEADESAGGRRCRGGDRGGHGQLHAAVARDRGASAPTTARPRST